MKIKGTNTTTCAIQNGQPGFVNMSLRMKSQESNALVYKRVMPFAPNNRINQSGQGKLFLWHDESNRYGLCWDAGREFDAEPVRLMLENSFTEYNVPLVLKTAQNDINMIKNAGSKARGIIVLTNPLRYALFLGKIEWHLEEMLEQIRSNEPVRRENQTAGAAEKTGETQPHPDRSGLGIYYRDLLAGMIGLEQELVENLRPQDKGENIRRQARRLAIDMTLLIKMVCDCADDEKNTEDAGIRRLTNNIQRWAM